MTVNEGNVQKRIAVVLIPSQRDKTQQSPQYHIRFKIKTEMSNISEAQRTIEKIPRPQKPLRPKHVYLSEANICLKIYFSALIKAITLKKQHKQNTTSVKVNALEPNKKVIEKNMLYFSKSNYEITLERADTGQCELRIK